MPPCSSPRARASVALRAGAGQARDGPVVGRDVRRHHAGGQAAGAGGGFGRAVQHRHLPAAPRQAPGHRGAGQPAADDGAAAGLRDGGRGHVAGAAPGLPARREAGAQGMALGRQAGRALDLEAAGDEAIAHLASHAPARRAGAAPRQPRHGLEGVQAPHGGVARGAEAVEVDGVVRAAQLGQHGLRVADGQGELHALAVEAQPVHAGQQAVPLGGQLGRQRRQLGEGRGAAHEVARLGRKGLDRAVEQVRGPRRVLPPRPPGRQEVQAQAEAGLQHRPARGVGPGGGRIALGQQAAAAQEHVPRLRQPAGAAVDVAETRAGGRAVAAPVDGGVGHADCFSFNSFWRSIHAGLWPIWAKICRPAPGGAEIRRWAARSRRPGRRRRRRSGFPSGA